MYPWHTATVWTALLSAAASAAPMAAMPAPVEPVLEWAERDRRRSGRSRAGLLVTTVSPGLALVGFQVSGTVSDSGSNTVSGALIAAGLTGMAVGPPLLLAGAHGAATSLRRQGLEVPRTAVNAGTACLAVAWVGLGFAVASGDPSLSTAATAGYLGAAALGGLQQGVNHRARERAGWVRPTVVPLPGGLGVGAAF